MIDYEIAQVEDSDKGLLAELRLMAMQESLERIGRFDPERARKRFLDGFSKEDTKKILVAGNLVGFYVLKVKYDHLYLDHLYFYPGFQNLGLGGSLIDAFKQQSTVFGLPIRLEALRESRSNEFYIKHGFVCTHEEEWDILYEFTTG